MNKSKKYYYPFNFDMLCGGGCQVLGASFFYKGFRPELLTEPIGFIGSNNSEVTLSASMVTSGSNVLLLTTTDRDIKLLGKAIDTPNGWGNLGIGS